MKMQLATGFIPVLNAAALLISAAKLQAQGTVAFDGAALFSGITYQESGMLFQVVLPGGGTYDYMAGSPAITGPSNIPYNPTPYMNWLQQFNSYDFVALTLTNGAAFGLTTVQLADPNSPSTSAVPISFVGHLSGGSTVTNTFTTPGNGATTFESYTFNPDFASGLISVDILAPRWAMDNLVFTIPEPSSIALILLGAGILLHARTRKRDGKG